MNCCASRACLPRRSPILAILTAPGAPLTPELQAAALWTYIEVRAPRFTSADALAVVRELQPQPAEDLKHLAKRLRPVLVGAGVRAKHAACLEAAARIQGHAGWHEAEHASQAPRLRMVVLCGRGSEADVLAAGEEVFTTWQDLAPRMAHWCNERHRASGARVFEVHVGDQYLMVTPHLRLAHEVAKSDDSSFDVSVRSPFQV